MPKTRKKPTNRLDTLNLRQQRFILHYCSNGFNAVQAALDAKYSVSYALSRAAQIAQKDGVREAIEEVKSKKQADFIEERLYTRTQALNEYDGVHTLALTKHAKRLGLEAANTAIKGKARLFGLDLDHSQVDIYPGRRPDDKGPAVQASKDRLQAYRESQQIEPQTIKSIESVQIDSESQGRANTSTESKAGAVQNDNEDKGSRQGPAPTPEGGAGGG